MELETRPTRRQLKSKDNMLKNYWLDSKYSPGVLVGNWFEDQQKYLCSLFQHRSTYSTDYTAHPPPFGPDYNFFADRMFENEGVGSQLLIEHGGSDYYNNYSTSYDLHYRYCPQGLIGPRSRKLDFSKKMYQPEQDYTLNYQACGTIWWRARTLPTEGKRHPRTLFCMCIQGNLTHSGLRKYKFGQWCAEARNRHKLPSEYREVYLPHSQNDLNTKRIAIPRTHSSSLCSINLKNSNTNFRGKKMSVAPDIPFQIPEKPNLVKFFQPLH